MDARQCRSKSVLTKFHGRAGSLPPSVRPEASRAAALPTTMSNKTTE